MSKIRLGFAICGSFCTFSRAVAQLESLCEAGFEVYPILSEISYQSDTRFGAAKDWLERIERAAGREIIHTIQQAEPIGPKALLDILVVEPCTGNTLGKLAGGITDSSVTMAVKAHLRNERPVVIALSTNDALGASARNLGMLLNRKNIYFVPMRQDDPVGKTQSIVADFSLTRQTIEYAQKGVQLQPILL